MRKTTKTLLLLLSAALLLSSCREPVMDDSTWVPDAGDFDAGEDDAGPGEICPPGSPDLFNNAYSPYKGGEVSVDLEVVNFSYFRCPHCADFADWSRELWETKPEYQERVRLYFHHYPFSGETAWKLHAATVAAQNQGMENFWAMHDYIYDSALESIHRTPDDLRAFAEDELGLDMDQYDQDVADDSPVYGFLEWDKAQGQSAGVSGTPKVFICGQMLSSWGKLETTVDGYLAED
jgi:protein-disulfide isomerase